MLGLRLGCSSQNENKYHGIKTWSVLSAGLATFSVRSLDFHLEHKSPGSFLCTCSFAFHSFWLVREMYRAGRFLEVCTELIQ